MRLAKATGRLQGPDYGRGTAWARLLLGALVLVLAVLMLMRGYAPPGPAGDVFRSNLQNHTDATPLFYTELESHSSYE